MTDEPVDNRFQPKEPKRLSDEELLQIRKLQSEHMKTVGVKVYGSSFDHDNYKIEKRNIDVREPIE